MKRSAIQYIRTQSTVRVFLSVGLMCLLLLLTTINFFIYSGEVKQHNEYSCVAANEDASSNPNPTGPDEKSPGNPISITEEYIHEGEDSVDPFWINALFRHKIHEAEQLKLVHFDIISPPPEV